VNTLREYSEKTGCDEKEAQLEKPSLEVAPTTFVQSHPPEAASSANYLGQRSFHS